MGEDQREDGGKLGDVLDLKKELFYQYRNGVNSHIKIFLIVFRVFAVKIFNP